ncbi:MULTISPECIES: ATP-dependent helicase [Cryobacterium]|uniref:ATP-dependent helicase n=1 Tax=Cryobacterium TaxID=69578 RepID=UPI00141BE786|nr:MULTISPECIES: ATP-dependent helicase [Cryobacterium]
MSEEQAIASASGLSRVFIEAGPGSGKTVVAVQLFGVQRLADPTDSRSVVALSFTRSATSELRSRITRAWGPRASRSPHRVCTIDAFLNEIVCVLLASGEIGWPKGRIELDVIDDWKTVADMQYGLSGARLTMQDGVIGIERSWSSERKNRIQLTQFREKIESGICSHDDVRRVLSLYLQEAEGRRKLGVWLRNNFRCVVVDEVFDANQLDIDLLRIAVEANIEVSVIGDPWQALYGFRGARPDLIGDLVKGEKFERIVLTRSYRFETDTQLALANELRAGNPVELVSGTPMQCDVVLAHKWETLWSSSSAILPMAIKSGSSPQWAIASIILHAVVQAHFGIPGHHYKEAFRLVGIEGIVQINAATARLEPAVGHLTLFDEATALRESWDHAVGIIRELSGVVVLGQRAPSRLKPLRARLLEPGQLVIGMTVHQSKGREWDNVGVVFTESELQHVSKGLSVNSEPDRVCYVALTRARESTFLLNEVQPLTGSIVS